MSNTVVSARQLTKRFGAKTAFSGISLDAGPGDVIGILGKNGAGKTTLLEVLLGFSPPTAGTCEVLGEPSLELSEAAKGRIGFVPQQDELIGVLSGKQQIGITSAFHSHWDHELIDRLIGNWNVPVDSRIQTMSVGERQKLSVLMALGHHPDLLVLDEPAASLDPVARRRFLQQLLDVSENTQRTVLFSSHIVSDIERAANKLWILESGGMLWQGSTDDLKESVVRLHVHARRPLPEDLGVAHVLSCRVNGSEATVVVTEGAAAARAELELGFDAAVDVEPLGLEEILLELHA